MSARQYEVVVALGASVVFLGCVDSRRETGSAAPAGGGSSGVQVCGVAPDTPAECTTCLQKYDDCAFAFYACEAECPVCDAPAGCESCVNAKAGIGASDEACELAVGFCVEEKGCEDTGVGGAGGAVAGGGGAGPS